MSNIKVYAEYVEEPSSKFDALVAQYNAAKQLADTTKADKQPLIDAMGAQKLELIKAQLTTIVDKMLIISKFSGDRVVDIQVMGETHNGIGRAVHIVVCTKWSKPDIYLSGYNINAVKDAWFQKDGIVTLWNELKLYDKLLARCEQRMAGLIESQMQIVKDVNANYEKMIHC